MNAVTLWTFDDYLATVHDDQKADLIEGCIYISPPETTAESQLFLWLLRLFADYVEARDLGRVFGPRVSFRFNKLNAPQPDIAFVKRKRLHRVRPGFVDGKPDLAVEIVSAESCDRDYKLKWKQYELQGISEYWLVDNAERQLVLLRPDLDGCYRRVRLKNGILSSRVLPGFWLRPEWL